MTTLKLTILGSANSLLQASVWLTNLGRSSRTTRAIPARFGASLVPLVRSGWWLSPWAVPLRVLWVASLPAMTAATSMRNIRSLQCSQAIWMVKDYFLKAVAFVQKVSFSFFCIPFFVFMTTSPLSQCTCSCNCMSIHANVPVRKKRKMIKL